MKNKFWNWTKNEDTGERILRLDGVIHDWDWFDELLSEFDDDDALTTPKEFREELNSVTGDIQIYLNSPGGNIFSAAEIYAMLKEYSGGKITAKIPAYAASSATIIAMAADVIEISPLAFMMIHNPYLNLVEGDKKIIVQAAQYLDDLKENIINAYESKTKLPRQQISNLMDAETYMNAKKAVELHFADKFMFEDSEKIQVEEMSAEMFSSRQAVNFLVNKFKKHHSGKNSKAPTNNGQVKENAIDKVDAMNLHKRLNLISH